MSKYYINQKFSFRDRFTVKNEDLEDVFYAEGEFFSFGKKIRLHTMDGDEVLYIKQKVLSLLSRYEFYIGNEKISEMKQEFTFFKKKYNIITPDWKITGDIWDYNYEIREGNRVIAKINKKWFSFMDAYEIEVYEEDYLELILGVVIVIDAEIDASKKANASG